MNDFRCDGAKSMTSSRLSSSSGLKYRTRSLSSLNFFTSLTGFSTVIRSRIASGRETCYEHNEVGNCLQYAEKHLEPPLISSNYRYARAAVRLSLEVGPVSRTRFHSLGGKERP